MLCMCSFCKFVQNLSEENALFNWYLCDIQGKWQSTGNGHKRFKVTKKNLDIKTIFEC